MIYRACLTTFLTYLIILLPVALRAQAVPYTPAQIERVAKLSELYGHIKFFHPYLGYKAINWDSAFAATAPRVAQAKTDDETVAALRQLLAVLGDEATTVGRTGAPPAADAAADTMRVSWTADSTLVLQVNSFGESDFSRVQAKLMTLMGGLPKARAVLLDLRSRRPLTDEERYGAVYLMESIKLAQHLTTQPIQTGGYRMRQHSGYKTESGYSSGGYWSGFYTTGGKTLQPDRQAISRPVVILLNQHAPLTDELIALNDHPNVRLFSTEPLTDAQLAQTVTFPFGEGITVKFRTGEFVNPDGSVGQAAIALVPATTRPDALTAYALSQARTPATPGRAGASVTARLPVAPAPAVYATDKYPTLGNRLLAGAKIWSVIHYFFAYKDLMPTSWNDALRTAVGQLASATDSTQYNLAVARFYRHLQDSHGFISGATPLRYYAGSGGTPIDLRLIEERPVVVRVYADSVRAKGVAVGDVLLAVNGEPISDRIARMGAIQPASNEWTRFRDLANRLIRGPVGTPIQLKLLGADGREKTVTVRSEPASRLQPPSDTSAVYRMLPGNVGYVHMGKLQQRDVPAMFNAFKNTKAIVFDMRNYPNGTAWTIAPYLTDRKNVVGAKFFRYAPNQSALTSGEEAGVAQKFFFDQQIPGNTGQTVYKGKTVMLIDERTQSQAEHSGLFFEAANGTEFIGSPSAGANGDVTYFAIPGGMTLAFSGHDVRHADGRQLQQVGLQPKIPVRPTIKGLRAGKDEVLDRAITYLNTGK